MDGMIESDNGRMFNPSKTLEQMMKILENLRRVEGVLITWSQW
jgi:hypothetical protein